MPLPWQREPDIEELRKIEERKTVELSIAEKNALIKKLKGAGLTGKTFGWNWRQIWEWAKKH